MKLHHALLVSAVLMLGAGCSAAPAPVAPEKNDQSAPTVSEPTAAEPTSATSDTATQPTAAKPVAKKPAPAPVAPKPANGAVDIKAMKFSPMVLALNVGATVTWTNNDTVNHTVNSSGSLTLNSGNLKPGASYSHTFKAAGTYNYLCNIHTGMTGTIIVR